MHQALAPILLLCAKVLIQGEVHGNTVERTRGRDFSDLFANKLWSYRTNLLHTDLGDHMNQNTGLHRENKSRNVGLEDDAHCSSEVTAGSDHL